MNFQRWIGPQVEGPLLEEKRHEVTEALQKMKTGKASGLSEVVTEMISALDEEGVDWLLDLLQNVWKQKRIPDNRRVSVLVPKYGQKGIILRCRNML